MTGAPILEHHRRPPSVARFMARAVLRSPGLSGQDDLPHIVQRWDELKFDPAHLEAFRQATGLAGDGGISVLHPHVLGFRLQMALLTHRSFPLPIWSVLQIRNRLVRHRRIDARETLRLETRIGDRRIVEKGLEIDLLSRLTGREGCCWESTVTYFYRGRFGIPPPDAPRSPAPAVDEPATALRFEVPRGGGLGFAKLTGDYNGIHYWPWYARRFGFRTAFPHPQRVAAMCMARLRGPTSDAQSLDLWMKGPVYCGSRVTLAGSSDDGGVRFALSLDGDRRPALAGCWQCAPA